MNNKRGFLRLAVICIALATSLFGPVEIAHGATFVVNSTADPLTVGPGDSNPGDGVCDFLGECTLRAAIAEANALPGKDTIAFDLPTSHTITINDLLPAITDPVVIDGAT